MKPRLTPWLTPPINDGDKALWVIVGDLPSAYLVTDEIDTPRAALKEYCQLMDDWVDAVLTAASLEEMFPVGVPPTRENAEQLAIRVRFLRESIIPNAPGNSDK